MTFITAQFDYNRGNKYSRLLKALVNSIKKNCKGAKIEALRIGEPAHVRANKGFTSNTLKMEAWLEAMNRIKDDKLIFIDCDIIVKKNIDDIWKKDFDVCYTKRYSENTWIPFNAGVIFVRNNAKGKAFMKLWRDINMKMYKDYSFHAPWRKKYAGMNQASLGYILENGGYDAKVISVPCSEWNCCNEDWVEFGESSRILHIKGRLRSTVLGDVKPIPILEPLYKEWMSYGG